MTQASFNGLMSVIIVLGFIAIEGSIFWLCEKYNLDPTLTNLGVMLLGLGITLFLAAGPGSLVHATNVGKGTVAWFSCLFVLIGTVIIIWTIVDTIKKRRK